MIESTEPNSAELDSTLIDRISLEQALRDVDVANARVIELTEQMLRKDERIQALGFEVAALKRLLNPRQRLEHSIRQSKTLYPIASAVKSKLTK